MWRRGLWRLRDRRAGYETDAFRDGCRNPFRPTLRNRDGRRTTANADAMTRMAAIGVIMPRHTVHSAGRHVAGHALRHTRICVACLAGTRMHAKPLTKNRQRKLVVWARI